jgi:hypothetical protein
MNNCNFESSSLLSCINISVDNRYALFGGGYTGSVPSNVVDILDSLNGKWNTTTFSQV